MNALDQIFVFDKQSPTPQQIRVLGTWEEPLFPATDVCRAVEIENVTQAISNVDEDDLCQTEVIDSLGRRQVTNCLTEAGLYTLLIRSDKPKARPFRRWVTREVLPSIRKTGHYSAAAETASLHASVVTVLHELALKATGPAERLANLRILANITNTHHPSATAINLSSSASINDILEVWLDVEGALACGDIVANTLRCRDWKLPGRKTGFVLSLDPDSTVIGLKRYCADRYQPYGTIHLEALFKAQLEWHGLKTFPGQPYGNTPLKRGWLFKVLLNAPQPMLRICSTWREAIPFEDN